MKIKKEDMEKLITTEGFEFAINKEASMVSQTIHSIEAACVYMAV